MLSISIIIPTLNSERTLRQCLQSISDQNYRKDLIEIIMADGGSTDETINIAKSMSTPTLAIVPNFLKTAEAGKAVGVKNAKNEIIAFIDSDNILPDKEWLNKMIEPFHDPEITASEPIEYTWRAEDSYITRYCALIGMNDPLCLFLGNYDRYCTLTGKWTEVPHRQEDKGNYFKVEFDRKNIPTIGANGFLIRKSALEKCFIGDYLFDIDVIYELISESPESSSPKFAKVKTGIIHIFSGNMKTFARKQKRRVRDYLYYNKLGIRKYPWKNTNKMKLLGFILSCLAIIPLLVQSMKGNIKKSDRAWFFHPIACWLTLWEYGWGKISSNIITKELSRARWSQ